MKALHKITPLKNIRLTNYNSGNVLINMVMNNFACKIRNYLQNIDAANLYGLDAGCGEGHLLALLHRQGVIGKVAPVDIDMSKLIFARNYYPFFDYIKGDVQRLEFSDNTFDYILTTEVFEHLPDPYIAMKEIQRVAKKRAYLIISVPFEPFFRWGNVVRGKYWKRGGRTPAHTHFWTQSQFRAFLIEFTNILESCSYSTFPWLLFLCRFKE